MQSTQEQWKPVVGYEGMYEVSDHGGLRSLNRIARNGQRVAAKLLSPAVLPGGYRRTFIGQPGSRKNHYIHQLVLAAFVGPGKPDQVVRHLNGDPPDNRLENLRWGTASENMLDAVAHGTHSMSSRTHCPKGHAYDAQNTLIAKASGGRKCRKCDREQVISRRAARGDWLTNPNLPTPGEVWRRKGREGRTEYLVLIKAVTDGLIYWEAFDRKVGQRKRGQKFCAAWCEVFELTTRATG